VEGTEKRSTWDIKYLYDGDCSMCQSLKIVLERQVRDEEQEP
jgi:predicted DCC family thiol-disulfide oxidoreductase YuxK